MMSFRLKGCSFIVVCSNIGQCAGGLWFASVTGGNAYFTRIVADGESQKGVRQTIMTLRETDCCSPAVCCIAETVLRLVLINFSKING